MEEEIQNEGLIERAQKAHKIIKNPRKYKICSGCESIVAQKVTICPNCHAYRFIALRSLSEMIAGPPAFERFLDSFLRSIILMRGKLQLSTLSLSSISSYFPIFVL